MKFKKISVIEPSNLFDESIEELKKLADEVVVYQNDVPETKEEIIRRIGGADAVILSYTTNLTQDILKQCPQIKYIGMSCTLYPPKSCTVDRVTADEMGMKVTGISNYGEEGVVEFVVSELIQLFHTYREYQNFPFEDYPREITNTKIGIIGLGSVGTKIANAFMAFGGDLYYNDLKRNPDKEAMGIKYLPLEEMLKTCTVVCTCLTKNIVALHEQEFEAFGTHKVLFNTGLSPTFEKEAVLKWLAKGDTYLCCDSDLAIGDVELANHDRVTCKFKASGGTTQCLERLNQKVLENIKAF